MRRIRRVIAGGPESEQALVRVRRLLVPKARPPPDVADLLAGGAMARVTGTLLYMVHVIDPERRIADLVVVVFRFVVLGLVVLLPAWALVTIAYEVAKILLGLAWMLLETLLVGAGVWLLVMALVATRRLPRGRGRK